MATDCDLIGIENIVDCMAKRIAALRRAQKLTLQDLSERSGLAKSHLCDLEHGRARNPTIFTAVLIAQALGISLDYLIGFPTEASPLHPEASRIACEIDALIRGVQGSHS